MRPACRHILSVVLAAACLSACARGPKIIPRAKMIRIYTDMFVGDEWLNLNDRASMQADTMLFYEPIFERYGYDTDDFLASMDHYMQDPTRYARMMKKVAAQLEKMTKEAQAREQREQGGDGEDRPMMETEE